MPPASVPTAGPIAIPSAIAALAMPRRSGGTWRVMILEPPGKAIVSPMPSITRSSSSEVKPLASPMASVLIAHSNTPAAISR